IPYLCWRLYRLQAGVPTGWASLSPDYLARAAERAADAEALLHIAREALRTTVLISLAALAAVLFAARRAGPHWRQAAVFALVPLGLYVASLVFVYLGTPL